MEPRIQYARTSDGVSIAYSTLGEGPVLLHGPLLFSHLQLEWETPECRRWYERLAERRQLVRYDPRGLGLSQRRVGDYAIEDWGRDIEAIADRLGFERFALLGLHHTGPMAIDYAARHPDRVSHLILWHSYVTAAEWLQSPRSQAIRAALVQDWDTYTEMASHMILGWSAGEEARRYAAMIRQSVEREDLLNILPALNQFDVSASLSAIRSPTLVLHRRDYGLLDVGVARDLAAQIRDARLVLLEGESGAPYLGDMEAVARAIDEFLSEGEESSAPAAHPGPVELPSGTAIILFADIVDSTALTEHLGDAPFREKARDLDSSLRAIIRDNAGTPIEGKLLGDGVLAVFTSARQAIEAALACGRAGDDAGLPLHLGVHAGDVIREEGNVYGGAVNISARIAAASAPGEVLVSETVRSLARTSAGVSFEDRGERELRGVSEPVRMWAVREQG
jgi:class 3 adenylate cyclase